MVSRLLAHSVWLLFVGTMLLNLTVRQSSCQETVEGYPLRLPGGGLAILIETNGTVRIARVFGKANPETVDLKEQDVVARANGRIVESLGQLRTALAHGSMGKTVTLRIRRGNKSHDVQFLASNGAFVVPKSAIPSGKPGASGNWSTASPKDKRPKLAGSSNKSTAAIKRHLDDLLAGELGEGVPGMSVSVCYGNLPIISTARGMANIESGIPMKPGTLLPVNSISKQLTAFAIASLRKQGRLELDDNLRIYFPDLSQNFNKVTLKHLLTHTSGLRDYSGLLAMAGWDDSRVPDSEQILALLRRQTDLQFKPGAEHRYSNTNYALLRLVVERVSGMPFAEWMNQNLFSQFRLENSSFPDRDAVLINSAELYSSENEKWSGAGNRFGYPGPSGLVCTASDLIKWSRNFFLDEGVVVDPFGSLTEKTRLNDGTTIDYGLGIGISDYRGVKRLSHGGSSRGSTSILYIFPDQHCAIAVIANFGEADVDRIAKGIAQFLLGDVLASNSTSKKSSATPGGIFLTESDFAGEGFEKGVALTSGEAERLAGRYMLEDKTEINFEAKGDQLLIKLAVGVPGVPLIHLGSSRFRFQPGRWDLSFEQDDEHARKVTMHLSDESISRRKPGDITGYRITTQAPDEKDLNQYCGQYVCAELGVVYEIELRNDQLVLDHPLLGNFNISHYGDDLFGVSGKVIRQIRFTRAGVQGSNGIVGFTATSHVWGVDAKFQRTQ